MLENGLRSSELADAAPRPLEAVRGQIRRTTRQATPTPKRSCYDHNTAE